MSERTCPECGGNTDRWPECPKCGGAGTVRPLLGCAGLPLAAIIAVAAIGGVWFWWQLAKLVFRP
ncbi:MAG: hypothetical protein KAY22_23505 [Rhizorhabdus sp.]|uniref:hypothetical protein n=1 Tax=Rhizorhabdus sp. TaxID=1968843 RepID=UPI001B64A159|nr:hypothetical protein [Rhizorhabdus sp.]MBP8235267.1 hypothetical protein [Rhizorhabdus sp.]